MATQKPVPAVGTVQSYEDEFIARPGTELPLEAQMMHLKGVMARVQQAQSVEDKVRVTQRERAGNLASL